MSKENEVKASIASFVFSIIALIFSVSALIFNIYAANKNEQILSQILQPSQTEETAKQPPSVHEDKYFLKMAGAPVKDCADGQFVSTLIISDGLIMTIPLYHDGTNITCLNGKPSTLNGVQISDKELSLIEQDAINRNIKKPKTKNAPARPVLDLGNIKVSDKDINKERSARNDAIDNASRSVVKLAGAPLQKCEDGKYIETLVLSKGFTYMLPLHSKGASLTCLNNKPSVNGVILTEQEINEIEKAVIDESITN